MRRMRKSNRACSRVALRRYDARMRGVRHRTGWLVLAGVVGLFVACGSPYGGESVGEPDAGQPIDADKSGESSSPTVDGGDASLALPACTAQRVVHLSATNGGLGWFTLVWPSAEIFANPRPEDAYDDRAKAVAVQPATDPHPLYVRKDGANALWTGVGTAPMPSVFVEGTAVVYSDAPKATVNARGDDIVAAGAAIQKSLQPLVPVVTFAGAPYGTAFDAPPATNVTDVDAAIAALAAKGLSPADRGQLEADVMTLASYGITANTPNKLVSMAKSLVFTAGAFRLGLVGTVVIPVFRDDPHTVDGPTADALVRILGAFYAALAKADEPRCSHRGARLSLADNVVMIVSGDTPRNSFQSAAWPPGPPGNTNILFARSNGWLKSGWFGAIAPNTKTSFDPTTGLLSQSSTPAQSAEAALGGILYAITRGNAPVVALSTTFPYQGTVAPKAP